MQEEAKKIFSLIAENYQLSAREEKVLIQALSSSLNFPRIAKIVELSIKNKLDKTTLVCFNVYQLIKTDPSQEDKIISQLTKEEKKF